MTVSSQVKGCFSSVKSAEATLAILANKTQVEEAKKAYEAASLLLSDIKTDLKKQVLFLALQESQYKK